MRSLVLSLFIVIVSNLGWADILFQGKIMTVQGPIEPAQLGMTLPHEHIMVDFIGADQVSPDRYQADEVVAKALPFLQQIYDLGCRTLVECTPNYLGRDPVVFQRLSQMTGLHILTNTGYYGAAGDRCVPAHAYEDTVEQLAARWTDEWQHGIGETGIRPGFIKIGVDSHPLSAIDQKLVQAAARAHRETGLVIAAHTGDGKQAMEELALVQAEGVRPDAFIWVHAQSEADAAVLCQVARMGAWVSLDGLSPSSIERHLQPLLVLKKENLLHRVMLSHDAGWYHIGEPEGGTFRAFDTLFTTFIPELKKNGFTEEEIQMMTATNPQAAFLIQLRLLSSHTK
ncbi:MAG: phosphotriesterase [bacterium]|jgi:phosphotriesterase-related protein|nr:phosphotriesterase [bacterium]